MLKRLLEAAMITLLLNLLAGMSSPTAHRVSTGATSLRTLTVTMSLLQRVFQNTKSLLNQEWRHDNTISRLRRLTTPEI